MANVWYQDAWTNGAAVDKADIRTGFRDNVVAYFASVAAFEATSTASLKYAVVNGVHYKLDASDTTSTSNGASLLVSADGGRYARVTSADALEWVSVKDSAYGAVGDGVTDDTAAIQAAIDTFSVGGVLATANGGVLYFPPGLYKITSGLKIEQTGVRVLGASQDATKIVVGADLGTAAAFEWDQTGSAYSQVGCGAENLRIDMSGYTGHGIWMRKAYDGVTVTNVYVDNVADSYNAFRLEEDSDVSDQISQTIVMTNCIGIHEAVTATGSVFYLQNVQEAVLQSCKGFGTYEVNGKAPCYPFELIDCRGIYMAQCSSAFASTHGVSIAASTRPTSGLTIINHTFETIDGAIVATGNANGDVINLRVINPRAEGAVSNGSGTIDLNRVVRSRIESNSLTVNLDSDCARVVVESDDDTQVTDNGTQTTLLGSANGIHDNYRVNPAIYSPFLLTANGGLRAYDTDTSHFLNFKPNSNLSADRVLNFVTGDSDQTFDLASDTTTPTPTAGSGTLTTVSASVRYWRFGTLVVAQIDVTITDAGTGAGALIVPLPVTASGAGAFFGRESGVTGFSVVGAVATSSTSVQLFKYDNTTIIGSGRLVRVIGAYYAT